MALGHGTVALEMGPYLGRGVGEGCARRARGVGRTVRETAGTAGETAGAAGETAGTAGETAGTAGETAGTAAGTGTGTRRTGASLGVATASGAAAPGRRNTPLSMVAPRRLIA